ncbi:MAG: hypothetical protein K2W96_20240 [Gemmataceae bacterium]|nr:hypothetical protein [Gemmataceae bacterium]
MSVPDYPWYGVAEGEEVEQGEILLDCPRFSIFADESGSLRAAEERVNAVVLTQSCDLVVRSGAGSEGEQVILCGFRSRSELTIHPTFGKASSWDEARKGRLPHFHVLDRCDLPGHGSDFLLVDFHRVFTLPLTFVLALAAKRSPRLRLLPPYREQLAQAAGRLISRVAAPKDIAPFAAKK